MRAYSGEYLLFWNIHKYGVVFLHWPRGSAHGTHDSVPVCLWDTWRWLLYLHHCVIPETHPFRLPVSKTFVYLYRWVVVLSVFCHLASQDYLDQLFLLPFYSFYIWLNCVFSFAPCFLISSVLIVNDKHRRTFSLTAFSHPL